MSPWPKISMHSIGMVEVVPQDISRAFLNILTNACQVIDEKRQSASRRL